jgi:hypothetical protein
MKRSGEPLETLKIRPGRGAFRGVQGVTVLHCLARLHKIAIQGATQGATFSKTPVKPSDFGHEKEASMALFLSKFFPN